MKQPVCVPCGLTFKVEKAGVSVFEMFKSDKEVYRIWQADKLRCRGCGVEVIYGFGQRPLAEHFQDGFKEKVDAIPAESRIYWYEKNLRDELEKDNSHEK